MLNRTRTAAHPGGARLCQA